MVVTFKKKILFRSGYKLCVCVCCRENEVLKVQLKKYVGAVQMLKREGSQGNDGKNTHTHTHAPFHTPLHSLCIIMT